MNDVATIRFRLVGFAALAAFTAANWMALVDDPPIGAAALATLCAVAGAAVLAAITVRVPIRWQASVLAAIAALGVLAGVAIAVGLPARLLAPSGWGELLSNLGDGIASLGSADYPYKGGDEWSRLALLLGLAPFLALAAALAFWPGAGRHRLRRGLGLVVLLAAYGTAVTVASPGQPLLRGSALFALVAAWIWLPALGQRGARAALGMLAVAGVAAIPLAGRLDAGEPWLDYRHWDWSGSPLAKTESFDWNHTYGPLDWARDGRTLLEVKSDVPHYWSTQVLPDFNGYRWVSSPIGPAVDLPPGSGGVTAPLNPDWIVGARFQDRALSSQVLVGTGTVLAVSGVEGSLRTPEGVLKRGGMSKGDSYSVRAYVPQPTPRQMRASESPYPHLLARYTTLSIPHPFSIAPAPGDLHGDPEGVRLSRVETPLRGSPASPAAAAVIQNSPYAQAYALAQRLAAGQPTSYDLVRAVQSHLDDSYTYSESPPQRRFPLQAFLFRDGVGYCQQFSGAMAMLLRMDGIPARVVGGFAPGKQTKDGFVVTDFDAHSWVEVFFNGIGWVTFDPTPPAAPAISRSGSLQGLALPPSGLGFRSGLSPVKRSDTGAKPPADGSGGSSIGGLIAAIAVLAGLLAGISAALAMLARRRRGRRVTSAEALAEAQALELQTAVAQLLRPPLHGNTLRVLENRLRNAAGPRAGAYAARLQDCRFGSEPTAPPGRAERRAVRRALGAGGGLKARLRAWRLIPPGGPAPL
jgi:transglutaminase-like putative cysteine protease